MLPLLFVLVAHQLAARRPYARALTRARGRVAALEQGGEEGGVYWGEGEEGLALRDELIDAGGGGLFDSEGGGGWGDAASAEDDTIAAAASSPLSVAIDGGRCDIDRRLAASLSAAEFRRRYVDGGRPVLIGGEGAGVGGMAGARRAWARATLLARHGAARVQVTRASAVVAEQEGRVTSSAAAEAGRTTLRAFVESLAIGGDGGEDGADGNDGDTAAEGGSDLDPLYLFKAAQLPGIEADIGASPYMDIGAGDGSGSARFSWTAAQRNRSALFSVGPRWAGAYWHAHSGALHSLAYGAKRWYLLPPALEHRVEGNGATVGAWLRDVAPSLPYAALECTQRAGEVLFVPEGWYHGVLNLANSVGIVVEGGPGTADWPAEGGG